MRVGLAKRSISQICNISLLVTLCFPSRELLRKQEPVWDRGQSGILVRSSLMGRFSLCIYIAFFTFRLVHCGSLVSTLVLLSESECPLAMQWSPTPVGMVRLVCSLMGFPSGRLVSPLCTRVQGPHRMLSSIRPHTSCLSASCLLGDRDF